MSSKCKYTALSRARNPDQVSFGNVKIPFQQPSTFKQNIERKIKGHQNYDLKNNLEHSITVEHIQELFIKQNGDCNICGCSMKTTNYKSNDKYQFSIDRIDSRMGHIGGNIQLCCWDCNRAKKAF